MRRRHATLAATLAATLSVVGVVAATSEGCAYDWALPQDATDGATPESAADAPAADALVETSATEGGVPTPCKSNSDCSPTTYCRFADHLCGGGQPGTCVPTAASTCTVSEWGCGCNGTVYRCLSEAMAARFDLSTAVACTPPAQTFRCGTRFCAGKSFCVTKKVDGVVDFQCVDFAGCATTNCSCPAVIGLACSRCDDMKPGQVQVTCP